LCDCVVLVHNYGGKINIRASEADKSAQVTSTSSYIWDLGLLNFVWMEVAFLSIYSTAVHQSLKSKVDFCGLAINP